MKTYSLAPEDTGLARASLEDLVVETLEEAAQAVRSVLSGAEGPRRDIVVLNAGAAIMVSGAAADLKAGMEKARASIDSGAAQAALDKMIEITKG